MESKGDKEYLPITGSAQFTKLAAKLAYGDESLPLKENRVCFLSMGSIDVEYICSADCHHPINFWYWCPPRWWCIYRATLSSPKQ